uniref:Uncharacterized protein n=1 Tax=viral metagenome TaxID=1070528 RepID=A0A6C0DZB7_9ZZZZ
MSKIPSIRLLQEEKELKENSKEKIFKVVLNKCVEKIVYTNRHTDKTFIIFEVPKILIGYPSYDMKSCLLYLIQKLSGSGYLVDFIDPFYLYVDWGCGGNEKENASVYSDRRFQGKLKDKAKLIKEQFPNAHIEFVYGESSSKKEKRKK